MATIKQLSFAGGEIAPSLYGRVDTAKYATGLRTCRNGIVMRHGGVQNRSGTRFITEVKDSTKNVKLIPFIFNAAQTYMLEFGENYIRFIQNGLQTVLASATVPDWVTATQYEIGDIVEEPGASGTFYRANTAHLSSGANQPPNAVWTLLSSTILEIPTTYLESELPDLRFIQSADVITIAHPAHAPADLSRRSDINWALTDIVFAPNQGPPTGLAVAGTAGSTVFTYHVTAIAASTFEESLAAIIVSAAFTDPDAASHTITWVAPTGAQEFNIYLEVNGVPGFIGIAVGTSFVNDGISPDTTDSPPIASTVLAATNDFPTAVTNYQQRLVFANTNNDPEKVFASRTALRTNMTGSTPQQADDAVFFTLQANRVNSIQHLIDIGTLIVFTSGGEWEIRGNEAGILVPAEPNTRQHSYNGSTRLRPLVINANALYVQARGSIIRDLGFDFQADGYRGNDLTIFASHLFDNFTLVDWDFQQIPHSVVWVVRSDGTLLGLTYVREHEIVGWHRHDTDGTFENVAVIPNGNEDDVYVVVRRNINGTLLRYIERFATRQVDEDGIEDSIFMDSSLSRDGNNTTAITMTLSGGPPWTALASLTLTASAPFFVSGDVGNAIHLRDATGDEVRCEIIAFTSTTIVTVRPHKDVPLTLQGVGVTTWGHAIDLLTNLSHLEAKDLSILADGFVVGSPNNDTYDPKFTVSGGQVTLDRPYVVIHVGLPYITDFYTLDVDFPDGETLADKDKLIQRLTVFLETSRGLFTGAEPPTDDTVDAKEGLTELKVRQSESTDDPVRLSTETEDVNFEGNWNEHGRTFMRQLEPLPLAVLSIATAGYLPIRGR